MSRVHALILAGGQGSRLGHVRKADLRLGGMRSIEHVARRLDAVERPLLISTGYGESVALEAGLCLPDEAGLCLPDEAGDKLGPMAGLVAGVRHLWPGDGDAVLITVAVDTPLLPLDYVARLLEALDGGAPAARAVFGDVLYPTNAAYRLGALAGLPEQFEAGAAPHSPRKLQEAIGAVDVDWRGESADDPFANLNTLTDLIGLARRYAKPN